MQILIEKTILEEAVQTACRLISAKSPLPILSHLLLQAEGETLRLTATDLDLGIALEVPAKVAIPGLRAIPGRLLGEIVSRFPASQVGVETKEEKVSLKCGRSKFEVASLPAEEYPSLPTAGNARELEFPQRDFRRMVRLVSTAVATSDESRAVMTGIRLELEGDTLTMAATDGRRMALAEHPLPEAVRLSRALGGGGGEAASVIVPGKAMAELARISADNDDPIRLRFTENQLFCTVRNVAMHCRLLEGHFPDVRRVLPTTFSRTVRAGREALLAALKRMLIVAQERQSPNLITLDLTDERLTMSANTPDLGLGQEEVGIIYDGADLRIAFNGKYMQDILGVFSADEVVMRLQDDTRSAVLQEWGEGDKPFRYVLMPVRLREAVEEPAEGKVAA